MCWLCFCFLFSALFRTRRIRLWERGRHFILAGTGISIVFLMILPGADRTENFLVFVVCLAVLLVSMGLYRSPAVALMPDLTPKHLRSKANAVINLMGAVGGVYTLLLIRFLVKDGSRPDYTGVFCGVAFI